MASSAGSVTKWGMPSFSNVVRAASSHAVLRSWAMHHRAALDEQLLAGLGPELQPTQAGLADHPGVVLIGAVAGAQNAMLAPRRGPGVARLPRVVQRDVDAPSSEVERGGCPGDPGSYDDGCAVAPHTKYRIR